MYIIYSLFLHYYHPPVNIPIKYALFWGFQYPMGVGCNADVTYILPASSTTKCVGRVCNVTYRQGGVVLIDSERGLQELGSKQQDWYLNGQKQCLSGPSLVYHLDAGQTVKNGVARPPMIEANKDKKERGIKKIGNNE